MTTARALVLAGAVALLGTAQAQTVLVRPQIDARLSYKDGSGRDGNGGDFIAEVSPGISILRESGRFNGSLNARLRNVAHFSESDRNDTFLSLHGRGEIEAVERMLFVDMDAAVTRNNRSQLSGRLVGDPFDTENANETRTFGVGPRLHFTLGAETRGMLSYMSRWMTGSGGLGRRREGDGHAQLSNPVQFGRIGWGLDYRRSDNDYGDVSSNKAVSEENARATLYATVTPQFRLRGIVGYESNDYEESSGDKSTIVGGGFDWNPTERTTISATTEKRIFGRGYDVQFSHRRSSSLWNLSLSRDISSSMQAQGFDVFSDPEFRGLYDALAQVLPDPIQREAFVRFLLGYPPIGQRLGVLTNVHLVSRNFNGSVSLLGVRNVLTIVLQQSERSRLGSALATDASDDFARFETVKTRSMTMTLSHRLSQHMTLNASVLRSRAEGSGGASAATERSLFSVGVTRQFGPNTSGGLRFSHQRSDGESDFSENVLMANLGISF
ncbi:TIGR03016 family PEP-CTERM system-associated outer membrane protein [Aromatoleum diolicum]|uniref:TIGR03016 family PEP-CTERM system-associated outer membrane protein n=1 Tax=Aromatoleum diolicum TaxID=75796 RepID=A0ABX1QC90_9RHOO|nr:TIGR03016 family PEP-CTERM system-associated outer membrane protein [Aromatoleum diolicum]